MNHMDHELREALKRVEPPPGFAERVMVRIPSRRAAFLPRNWMAAAAAVLVAVVGAGSWEYQRARDQRMAAEKAKAELIFALELTSSKLQSTRSMLLRQTGGSL